MIMSVSLFTLASRALFMGTWREVYAGATCGGSLLVRGSSPSRGHLQ